MDRPVKAVAMVLRGVPRGRVSAGGAPFFDPRDDEVLLGYPFQGGDLFGPQGNGGLTTPLVLIQPAGGDAIVALSALDDRVRTKRFYLQPGETGYRVEALVEAKDGADRRRCRRRVGASRARRRLRGRGAAFRARRAGVSRPSLGDANRRADWLRKTSLVVTLHGMHYTGYVFNDYARMLAILRWMATRIAAERVLVFLASWDGRITGTTRSTSPPIAWAARQASAR
jgi:hypothetical protein